MGYDVMSFRILMSGLMILFIISGNFSSKLRSIFFIGIRTPWTLSSEENWKLTHRLGGRIFMICGVVGFVITLIVPSNQMMSYLTFAVLLPCVIIPVAYSWYLFWQENK
uniref:SdpI family protein n=1 Tax=OCS116 cluster bacterium TaxID=2030921 RepID=A0A2A4YRW5_9PROT